MAEKTVAEKDYDAIARRKIKKPTGGRRRVLVYAKNKTGKTAFGISDDPSRTLVIDPEEGTEWLTVRQPDIWEIDSWEDVDEVYKYLRHSTQARQAYDWIVWDGCTKINDFALRWIMRKEEERDLGRRPGIIDRRDYNKSGRIVRDWVINCHNLPFNLVFTAQERTEEIKKKGDDEADEDAENTAKIRYVADMPKGARSALYSEVEVIGRLYVARVRGRKRGTDEEVTVNQRRLWLAPHELYDTGARSEYKLPDFIKNPTLPKLVAAMTTGEEV